MLDPLRQDISRQATGHGQLAGGAAPVGSPQAACRAAAATSAAPAALQVSNGVMAPMQPTGSYGPACSLTAPHAGAGSFILRRGGESPVSPASPIFPASFAYPSPSHMPTPSPMACNPSSHMPMPPQLPQHYQPSPAFTAANQLLPQAQPQLQAQCAAGARLAAPARALPEAPQMIPQARPASLAVPATLQMQQQAMSTAPRPLQAPASFNVPAARPHPASVALPATLQMQQQTTSLMPTPSPFASYGATPASLQIPGANRFSDVLGVSQAPAPRTMPTYSPVAVSNQVVTAGMQTHGPSFSMPMPRQCTPCPQPITMGTSAAAPTMPGMPTMQWPPQRPPLAIPATPWWGHGQSIPSSVTVPSAQQFQARHMLSPGATPMQTNRDFAMQAVYPSPISSPVSFQPRSPQMDAGFAMQAAQLAATKFPLPMMGF